MSKWFRSTPIYTIASDKPKVDFKTGIISKVAVNTEGEAKGHGVNLDADFVKDVTRLGNTWRHGLKARFGHPNMSSTALGTYVGRLKNFETEERDGKLISFADLHLDEVAKKAPGGDLYTYVLELANSNPDQFGMSIVFTPGREYKIDKDGNRVVSGTQEFEDLEGDPFTEIIKLTACDVVDDPAANESGLFSETTFAGIVTNFLEENPQIYELLKKQPEIVNNFMSKYNNNNATVDTGGKPDKTEDGMDLIKFRTEHPSIFEEAKQLGVKDERDRVNAHLQLAKGSGDMETSLASIENGEGLTATVTAKHMAASMKKNELSAREGDNADIETPAAPVEDKKLSTAEIMKIAGENMGLEVANA